MVWSTPRTWASGELVTAGNMNTYLSDNLRETGVAKAAAAGDLLYATAANALARIPIGASGTILTSNGSVPAWGTGPGMVKINESLYAADGTSPCTFSSIPGTYRTLVLHCALRSVRAGNAFDAWYVRLNGDTGNNYNYMNVAQAASMSSPNNPYTASFSRVYGYFIPASTSGSQRASYAQIVIHDYARTFFNKHIVVDNAYQSDDTGGNTLEVHTVGFWRNTAAVTSVSIGVESGTQWAAGSTFSLYGLA